MQTLRAWIARPEYQTIDSASRQHGDDDDNDTLVSGQQSTRFSRIEYAVFMLLGLATLWPFNMYLNAGPYLQERFLDDPWTRDNFQATETSVSSVVNLVTIILFTYRQANASYPRRIVAALVIYALTFVILAVSTRAFLDTSVSSYFAFLIFTVLITSFGTGLIQNGSFSYVSSYGQPTYMQGMMVGQAVAGVMPSVVQIMFALGTGNQDENGGRKDDGTPAKAVASNAAFGFFLTASVVAVATLIASCYLFARRPPPPLSSPSYKPVRAASPDSRTAISSTPPQSRKPVSLFLLANKLRYLASAVIVCFTVTMASFPVVTQEIISVNPDSKFTKREVFIPLAFLFWNSGDLLGRIITAWPVLTPHNRPRLVLFLSLSRALLVPVYLLCNIRGRGAAISSDAFYLGFQLAFGLSNGYVGSLCMMSAGDHVQPEEAEAAGSFMGICLILGLGIGSLLSFAFTVS